MTVLKNLRDATIIYCSLIILLFNGSLTMILEIKDKSANKINARGIVYGNNHIKAAAMTPTKSTSARSAFGSKKNNESAFFNISLIRRLHIDSMAKA